MSDSSGHIHHQLLGTMKSTRSKVTLLIWTVKLFIVFNNTILDISCVSRISTQGIYVVFLYLNASRTWVWNCIPQNVSPNGRIDTNCVFKKIFSLIEPLCFLWIYFTRFWTPVSLNWIALYNQIQLLSALTVLDDTVGPFHILYL